MEVRRAEKSDLKRIGELEREIFPDPWTPAGIEESFYQKHVVILGAWLESRLVGYVIFYFTEGEGEIVRIAVEEKHRRRGAAGHLLLGLEDICEKKHIRKLFLEVRESNQTAIEFYKSNGFTEDGLRKNFYEKPIEDAVLMSRELGR